MTTPQPVMWVTIIINAERNLIQQDKIYSCMDHRFVMPFIFFKELEMNVITQTGKAGIQVETNLPKTLRLTA